MPMAPSEREVVADLIGTVRTLAKHILILHLQLGAVRAILARKGTVTEAEVSTALSELDAVSVAGELLSDRPSVEQVFADLLRRLEDTADSV